MDFVVFLAQGFANSKMPDPQESLYCRQMEFHDSVLRREVHESVLRSFVTNFSRRPMATFRESREYA